MPSVTTHFDGWMLLPARLWKPLGVRVGNRIKAEFVDGGLLLWTERQRAWWHQRRRTYPQRRTRRGTR